MNPETELLSDEIQQKRRNPFYGLVALFLAVTVFLLSLEGWFYLIHPSPSRIVALDEVQSFIPEKISEAFTPHQPEDVKIVLRESQSPLKQIANYVAAQSCKSSDSFCQSRAVYYFVRDNIQYVPDPQFRDKLENPLSVLKTGGADCEDMAVLEIALQKAIGNSVRLVFIPGHAYAQVSIPDYKNGDWLNLEATCKTCDFNEIPESTVFVEKEFVEL